MRVLIVEDEPDLVEMLGECLAFCGHAVQVASTGQAALSLLAPSLDAIIVDIGLPDIDGITLTARMRALGVTARIIALTGYTVPRVREAAMTAGIDAFLVKPFTLASLRAELDRIGH